MAYSIKDVVTQITNDFSTVEFDLAENRITLEQYQERLQNSRLLVFIENLLLLTPEAALISFQKQCNSGAQIPEDYKHKILAALKDRITLFYTDDLAVLVNAIPQDLPLKETCEALGKCYDDLFIKHEQLKAIGFIFESHYKTMFIDNSKNVIANLKNLASESEDVQINKIQSSSFDTSVIKLLSTKFSPTVAQYFKVKKIQYSYAKIRAFPILFKDKEPLYRQRITNEFTEIVAKPSVDLNFVLFNDDKPVEAQKISKEVVEEPIIQNIDTPEIKTPSLVEVIEATPPITKPQPKAENIIPLADLEPLLMRLTTKYNESLNSAFLEFLETLNAKKINVHSEDAIKVLDKLYELEAHQESYTPEVTTPDNSMINSINENYLELRTIIQNIQQVLESSENHSSESIHQILSTIEKINISNSSFADNLSQVFSNHADNLQKTASNLISQELKLLSPEMISQQILKLSELSSQALIDKINNLESSMTETFSEINLIINEIERKYTDSLATNNKSINSLFETSQKNINQSVIAFTDKLDTFKTFLNDELIKKLSDILSNGNDLSRHLKITQSLLEKNKPAKNSLTTMFLSLNLIISLAVLFFVFGGNSGKPNKDSLELNRILVNINKLDATNKASVAKVLEIPMKDITNAANN